MIAAARAEAASLLSLDPLADAGRWTPPSQAGASPTATAAPLLQPDGAAGFSAPVRPVAAPAAANTAPAASWSTPTLPWITVDSAAAIEPSVQAARALAESLREDASLKAMLGSALAVHDGAVPDAVDEDHPAIDPLGADSLVATEANGQSLQRAQAMQEENNPQADRRRPTLRRPGNPSLIALNDNDFGITLRDVARAVVTLRPADGRGPPTTDGTAIERGAIDVVDSGYDDGMGLGIDIATRALQSRLLGDALLAIIDRSTELTDGQKTFSVLGVGTFELDMSADLRSISVSEETTGTTIGFAQNDDAATIAPTDTPLPGEPKEHVSLLLFAVNLMLTPTGTLVSVVSAVLVLIWGMGKLASRLRMR